MKKLPGMCFIFHETAERGEYIKALRYGESGYFATTYCESDPKIAEALVEHLNRKLGVSDLQVECMLAGSMFGWDTPGADPDRVAGLASGRRVPDTVFISKSQSGAVLYEIKLPGVLGEKYATVEPMPLNDQKKAVLPVGIKTEVRLVNHEYISVVECGENAGKIVADLAGRNRFDEAVLIAEKRGLPWMVSGGSEVFDPASCRCWSFKSIEPIRAVRPTPEPEADEEEECSMACRP